MKRILVVLLAASTLLPGQNDSGKDLEYLKKAAFNVDTQVARIFQSKKLPVPEVVDDPTFLRRSFLVAAGRIPTLDESRQFLEIGDPNKREMLTEYLLKSDGYRSHMTNWIMDLLRVEENFGNGRARSAAPYLQFITESVANNVPWDDFVKQLVAAEGNGWEKGNGAVGFYVRDKGMALDNMAIMMRVFTGERFECAQCHDSPANKWERIDFYELAAFTNGQYEMNKDPWKEVWKDIREEEEQRSDLGELVRWLGDNIHYNTLAGGGKGRIALPDDYQYRGGDPGEMIAGKTKFGDRIRGSDRKDAGDSRTDFAEWMTDPDNENFKFVIVNRMWDRIMGTPLSAPVDEYKEPDATISPELFNYLTGLLVDLDYDLKAFQHVLLLTKTFQFSANSQAFEAGLPQAVNGRQLERMTAEQMWDSLVTLVAGDPDQLPKRGFTDNIYYRGKMVLVGQKTMEQLSQELLAIQSGSEYRDYVTDLLGSIKSGGGSKKKSEMMSMAGDSDRPGPAKGLARASELPAPAPAGHFLREFGQSDRLLIDSASREPNMAQVLSVMNGHVEEMVVSNDKAAVYKALEEGSSDADKVRYLYYAILSRPPSEGEMKILMQDVIDGSKESYRNLVSALVSTHEFIFIQ